MQVILGGRNIHLTPGLHELTQQKLDRFERVARGVLHAEVSYGEARKPRPDGRHDCTVTLHLEHESLVTAHAHGESPVAALDGALAKLRHQLERVKSRRVSRARGARRAARRDRAQP
jgi:ribosomal subunit interface protein